MLTEPYGQRFRLLAFVALFVCLLVMLVGGGTIAPDPAMNNYPDNHGIGPNSDPYIDQQVELGGTVVATDPLVVRVDYAGNIRKTTFENVDESVTTGQQISAFGTLTDASTLDVETALVRSPWEAWYMYAVSFLGGLWVLGRILRHWRPDRDRLAFVPRGESDG